MSSSDDNIVILNSKYRITKIRALKGLNIIKRLAKFIGPAFAEIIGNLNSFQKYIKTDEDSDDKEVTDKEVDSDDITDEDKEVIGNIINMLLGNLDDGDDVEQLILDMLNCVLVYPEEGSKGKPEKITKSVFDMHFTQNYSDIAPLLIEVVKYNNFLGALGLGSK